MKLTKHNNQLKSNIKVESQEFGIGDASVVIEILRNRLYKHKVRTLVQEYICNARDAMREIDSDKDIVITAPTQLNPTFRVRDYGQGITPDRMRQVFVLYGASTKRDTNSQTGGFGIGAKSAWSYTDSFTIITYIDGIKRTYVAHTGVNNNGRLDLIDESETSELNGTEINIAVSQIDIGEFNTAITRCLYFWKNGYKTLNLNKFNHTSCEFYNKYLELVGNNHNLPEYILKWNSKCIFVIDSVVYDGNSLLEKSTHLDKLRRLVNGPLVIHVPNGTLEVSASREEISESKFTINNVDMLAEKLFKSITAFIESKIQKCKEPSEFIEAYTELSSKFKMEQHSTFGKYKFRYGSLNSQLFESVGLYTCRMSKGKLFKVPLSKDRYGLSNLRIYKESLDKIYYEQDDSKVKLNNRIRQILKSLDHIILVSGSGPEFNEIVKDLNVKPIQSIELPIVPKVKRKAIPRSKKEICLHEYSGYHRTVLKTTSDDNTKVWHYFVLNGNSLPQDVSKMKLYDYKLFFNINICGIAPSYLDLIKNDKNFVKLDDLIKNYKPTKEDIMQLFVNETNTILYKNLVELPKTKNNKVNNAIQILAQLPDRKNKVGLYHFKDIISNAKLYKKLTNLHQDFQTEWNKIPMLSQISGRSLTFCLDDVKVLIDEYAKKEGKDA